MRWMLPFFFGLFLCLALAAADRTALAQGFGNVGDGVEPLEVDAEECIEWYLKSTRELD